MTKKFSVKYLLLALPILALLGFIGYRVQQAIQAKAELQPTGAGVGGRGGGGGGGRAQTVQTGVVSSGKVSEKITLTGALKAKERVEVSSRIAGRILKLNADVGQAVTRGALLVTIEDDEIQQQLERSKAAIAVVDATIAQREAELSNAKAELERRRKLSDEGLLPRTELDALEMRYRVAQSQAELARAQRRQAEAEQRELAIRQSQTRIYAPITGVVAQRQLDLGALANTNTPIMTLVSVNPMVIEARTSERDIARIRRGATVSVTVDSLPEQTFNGRVLRIQPQLDAQTRNGIVEIEIANRNGVLKGEMFARAVLDLGSQRETTLLPRDALVYRGEQSGVYFIEAETAKFQSIETGLTQDDKVEVVNGLKVGDVVITRGSNLLKDGDRVRIERSAGKPDGGSAGGGQANPKQSASVQPSVGQPSPAGPSGGDKR